MEPKGIEIQGEDIDSLRVMGIKDRAELARDRIINHSHKYPNDDGQWLEFFTKELMSLLQDGIRSVAMTIEQDYAPEQDKVNEAMGNLLRDVSHQLMEEINTLPIVASIDIDEDGSVDTFGDSIN